MIFQVRIYLFNTVLVSFACFFAYFHIILHYFTVYSQCANHGVCNPIGGKCDCQIGFKGIACEDMSDSTDINSTTHNGPFFTATLHKLNVIRTESSDFNIFQAQVSGENVTTIRGDRLMEHTGKVKVKGPLAVGYDGDVMRSTSMVSMLILLMLSIYVLFNHVYLRKHAMCSLIHVINIMCVS